MNARGLRRYVDDLLRGRAPKPFAPDDFEAAQIRTAIELRAAGQGDDAPRHEFLDDLHRRLAEQMTGAPPAAPRMQNATRRGSANRSAAPRQSPPENGRSASS